MRIILLYHGIISSPSCPSSNESFKWLAVSRVRIKRIYQSYRVIFRVALLPSELFTIFIAGDFVLGIIPQPKVFGISSLSSG